MNWWSILKNDDPLQGFSEGMNPAEWADRMQNHWDQQPQETQPQPPEQEESKPLYDQKQQLGIAHYLLDDIQQIAQLLRELHDDGGSADWERLLFDVERIKQVLEDALTGGGPTPSGGGM